MKPPVRLKLYWIVGGILAAWLLATSFQAVFWTRDHARAQGLEEVTQFCLSRGRDPALLRPLGEDTIGNALWSFEWEHAGEPRYLIGVWFAWDGHPECYFGPRNDPRSAAYESRRTATPIFQ